MTHIDEGTIHAWLDGALDDAEARRASEHAASCSQCGALVVEARGLIAGASRILTALDDVPAGIAPKRAPVLAAAKPATRYWQAAPWVTGIAAALILAVGLKMWLDAPSAKSAVAPVTPLRMDSLRAATLGEAGARPASSTPRVTRESVPPRLPQPRTVAGAQVGERQLAQGASPEAARRDARASAGAGLGSGVPASAAAIAQEAPGAVVEVGLAKKAAVADALQPSAALIPAPQSAPMLARAASRARVDERQLAGCYRADISAGRRDAAMEVTVKAEATGLTAPVTSLSIVRLDTAMTPRGRAVRSVATGEVIGIWSAAGGDSVRLELPVAGLRTLPISRRVMCPP